MLLGRRHHLSDKVTALFKPHYVGRFCSHFQVLLGTKLKSESFEPLIDFLPLLVQKL